MAFINLLINFIFYIFFFLYVKISKNLSAKYCQENKRKKETARKACERYYNISKEEKEKKQQYGRERY